MTRWREVDDRAKTAMLGQADPRVDALHIACAALNGVDYLLTWNCKHIANFERLPAVERICRDNGYEPPRICTPAELMGDE